MTNISTDEILKLDRTSYESYFNESSFGFDLATQIAKCHGYDFLLERKTEGSSLVFALGSDYFLKISPPFFDDSIDAEIKATKAIGAQLPFSIPNIIAEGSVGTWKYIVTKKVPGQQAKNVFRSFNQENKLTFASDIGNVIKALNNIETINFERSFGSWDNYLANRLQNQKSIHSEKGNSVDWTEKICSFVEKHKHLLINLGPAKLIHADLNHEHLMLNQIGSEWRISGVLDFADAMNAPIEMEFILPIICFFKGNIELQQKLWLSSGHHPV